MHVCIVYGYSRCVMYCGTPMSCCMIYGYIDSEGVV